MRIIVTVDDGRPHDMGRRSLIIEPATHAQLQELKDAADGDPDEVLSIPNARLHVAVDTTGTASVRAGHIVEIREG